MSYWHIIDKYHLTEAIVEYLHIPSCSQTPVKLCTAECPIAFRKPTYRHYQFFLLLLYYMQLHSHLPTQIPSSGLPQLGQVRNTTEPRTDSLLLSSVTEKSIKWLITPPYSTTHMLLRSFAAFRCCFMISWIFSSGCLLDTWRLYELRVLNFISHLWQW